MRLYAGYPFADKRIEEGDRGNDAAATCYMLHANAASWRTQLLADSRVNVFDIELLVLFNVFLLVSLVNVAVGFSASDHHVHIYRSHRQQNSDS
ncbi:Hypothetical protein SMAX5B_013364 [Scophthalmus maximus]|uniref:Uncharacterized protein n=1 Tax=Scophthalmus maximus TaxID=52904 RepID=A0A2U9B4S7_SCOMX|nr:Hypothetical protein SMAX5B_013364 [Scophthalmus maximus]